MYHQAQLQLEIIKHINQQMYLTRETFFHRTLLII